MEKKLELLRGTVFNQKLNEYSEKTFTAVIDEATENDVIRNMHSCPNEGWDKFALEYFSHYSPFKSSVKIMIDNLEDVSSRKVLMSVLRQYSITVEEFRWMYEKIKKSDEDWSYLLVIYCRFCRRYDQEVKAMLDNLDLSAKPEKKKYYAVMYEKYAKR